MASDAETHSCMTVLSQIKDPKVRFFWLKLGEALASGAYTPTLIEPPAPKKRRKPKPDA